jgi:hypothetical protein
VNEALEQFDFGVREREFDVGLWHRSAEHGEPEYARSGCGRLQLGSLACRLCKAGTPRLCNPISGSCGRSRFSSAFPIADVNAAHRVVEKPSRLAHVLKPAPAFLFLNRYARGIDMALKLRSPLELLSRPHLHRRQAKWQSVGADGETRMQDAALRAWLSPTHAAFFPFAGLSCRCSR